MIRSEVDIIRQGDRRNGPEQVRGRKTDHRSIHRRGNDRWARYRGNAGHVMDEQVARVGAISEQSPLIAGKALDGRRKAEVRYHDAVLRIENFRGPEGERPIEGY